MFERLMRQIEMMKEVAVDGANQSIESNLIHKCYKEYDNGHITVVQLRDLLNRI
jgi:hypothetical protein